MQRQRLIRPGLSLAVNILLSWTLLPFLLPPFQGYSLSQLFEVLLWQGMGMIGWPFALLGGLLSLAAGGSLSTAASLLFMLVYPLILGLVILIAISKKPRRIAFVLLHVCVALSFAVMWASVLNGYDFMTG
ncbi:MAG: hypothetical protein ACOY0R_14195 [Chloroflexota bacterium]